MNNKKLIKEIEREFHIEFPFEYQNVSVYDIEDESKEILEEKTIYYKILASITFEKENIEAYLSYYKKLDSYKS